LMLGRAGTAERSHLAVRPRLTHDPTDRVIAIVTCAGEKLMLTLRPSRATLILNDERVAPRKQGLEFPAFELLILVVRRPNENGGQRCRGLIGANHRSRKPHSIAHRHHEFALQSRLSCEARVLPSIESLCARYAPERTQYRHDQNVSALPESTHR